MALAGDHREVERLWRPAAATILPIPLSGLRRYWNDGGATFGIEFPCDKRGKGFCGPAMT